MTGICVELRPYKTSSRLVVHVSATIIANDFWPQHGMLHLLCIVSAHMTCGQKKIKDQFSTVYVEQILIAYSGLLFILCNE